ncbi:MAG: sigma 54-interacting transcriptional regulator [Alphaproteobacteria bacterium]|nr:sigma 54-interacting transcriptional regulator [Alphaproteobacteria bacterium]
MSFDILIINDNKNGLLAKKLSGFNLKFCQNADECLLMMQEFMPTIFIFRYQKDSEDLLADITQLFQQFPQFQSVKYQAILAFDNDVPLHDALAHNDNFYLHAINDNDDKLPKLIQTIINDSQQKIFSDFVNITNNSYEHYLIGGSLAVQELQQNLKQAATSNSRVLLSGAVGTGKWALATYIHNHSARKNLPIGFLSCGVARNDIIETQLFGKEDGNGNIISIGLLEQTHSGTLILDKIELLPLSLQQKMARLLQQNSLQRIAGKHNIRIDTRIIATIGTDSEQAIQDKQLDRDFYQRVSLLEIMLPSLAERRVDIIEIVHYFNLKWAKIYAMQPIKFITSALNIIEGHNWQGNFFALNNFIERFYLRDTQYLWQAVDDKMVNALLYPDEPNNRQQLEDMMRLAYKQAKEKFEKQYLRYQLQHYGGNISQTAKFIGVNRVSLHRKIKMLNLPSQYEKKQD